MQSIGRWADASGHPSGAALVAEGYVGVFVYAGTPGRAKNITAAVYADYVAHGLQVVAVYENVADDISSGAGAQHARDIMADLAHVGAPNTLLICAAADEHLTAGQVVTATGYQRDFWNTAKGAGWSGPVGGYGFSEFTHAIHDAGLSEFLWQCGSESLLWDGVTWWQRNDGTAVVGGVQVDINEQYQEVTTMPTAQEIAAAVWAYAIGKRPDGSPVEAGDAEVNEYLAGFFGGGDAGAHAVYPTVNALAAKLDQLNAKVDALQGTTPAAMQAMIDAAIGQHMQITGTVQITGAPPASPPPAA
ncbi:glycoside hydrolase domain-containing protein [Amycolatopsis benzoatilytica]|uniref:glycoside hydrolase domain-containing protein n=1 Tax=Amycolatopsis benzoatilytica TaxID=346045 RepID=UPI000371E1E4|nr:glycoside hydrolase domain-containing protein [Amycolatopsis benzoatilytica]